MRECISEHRVSNGLPQIGSVVGHSADGKTRVKFTRGTFKFAACKLRKAKARGPGHENGTLPRNPAGDNRRGLFVVIMHTLDDPLRATLECHAHGSWRMRIFCNHS